MYVRSNCSFMFFLCLICLSDSLKCNIIAHALVCFKGIWSHESFVQLVCGSILSWVQYGVVPPFSAAIWSFQPVLVCKATKLWTHNPWLRSSQDSLAAGPGHLPSAIKMQRQWRKWKNCSRIKRLYHTVPLRAAQNDKRFLCWIDSDSTYRWRKSFVGGRACDLQKVTLKLVREDHTQCTARLNCARHQRYSHHAATCTGIRAWQSMQILPTVNMSSLYKMAKTFLFGRYQRRHPVKLAATSVLLTHLAVLEYVGASNIRWKGTLTHKPKIALESNCFSPATDLELHGFMLPTSAGRAGAVKTSDTDTKIKLSPRTETPFHIFHRSPRQTHEYSLYPTANGLRL